MVSTSESEEECFSIHESQSDSDEESEVEKCFQNFLVTSLDRLESEHTFISECLMFSISSNKQMIEDLEEWKAKLALGFVIIKRRLQEKIDDLQKKLPATELKLGEEEEESWYEYFIEYQGTPFVLRKITYMENKIKIKRE